MSAAVEGAACRVALKALAKRVELGERDFGYACVIRGGDEAGAPSTIDSCTTGDHGLLFELALSTLAMLHSVLPEEQPVRQALELLQSYGARCESRINPSSAAQSGGGLQ